MDNNRLYSIYNTTITQIYNDNLIWSTCDVLGVTTSIDCDLDLPLIPFPTADGVVGTENNVYPNYMKPASAGLTNISFIDTSIVLSQGLPVGELPGWGDLTQYNNNDFRRLSQVGAGNDATPMAWFEAIYSLTHKTGISKPRNEINPQN